MHGERLGAKQQTCTWCPVLFKPRRRWQRFCSPKCRNDYHHWARPHVVRELRELVSLALEGCDPLLWNPRARKVLGLKDAERRDTITVVPPE